MKLHDQIAGNGRLHESRGPQPGSMKRLRQTNLFETTCENCKDQEFDIARINELEELLNKEKNAVQEVEKHYQEAVDQQVSENISLQR